MCEHYIARGLCTDFPDWTIAVAGCESCVKIGYDYGRSVTGVEHEVEPDLNEEDQVLVPDPQEERMMVATSSEVCTAVCIDFFLRLFKCRGLDSCLESVIVICFLWLQVLKELGLDAADLLDDEGIDMGMDKDSDRSAPDSRSIVSHSDRGLSDAGQRDLSVSDAGQCDLSVSDAGQRDLLDTGLSDAGQSSLPFSDDSPTVTDWRDVPLPDSTPGRRRNVARRRAMGGDSSCVPPDFNRSMSAIWEELWHSMPQSGKISVTVHSLLQQYKERCRAERKRPRDSDTGPPALLPVSFAQAKDWLLKQQKALSEALETGAVNEEAREVVADLTLWPSSQRLRLHFWSSQLDRPLL